MWALIVVAVIVLVLVGLWARLTQPVFGAASCPQATVDPERLKAHVRMLSQTLAPRSWDEEENLARSAQYISQQLEAHGAQVSSFTFEARYGGIPSRVVVGKFGPDTEEVIVVGAHYDAYGGFPGADDNASGVAGMLELGALLGKQPPAMRVELVGYPNEEPPHFMTEDMGSVQHARALKKAGKRVRAMLSLEMLGYFSDEPGSQKLPASILKLFYPDKGNFIAVVGSFDQGPLVRTVKGAMRGASKLPVHSINAPRIVPGIDFSDHASYWDEGFDAVMITDTAFYRNPHYHTPEDTWQTLDYGRMAHVVEGVHCAVRKLASR